MIDAAFSPPSPPDAFASLQAALGDRLTVDRRGERARWSYDGHSALIDLRTGTSAEALFVAPPVLEEVTQRPMRAAYRAGVASYALTPGGAERLAADMLDFFTGRREPHFRFAALTNA